MTRPLLSFSMPNHLHRYYGAGDLHLLTFSCYQRQPFLGSVRRRDLFLRVLEAMRCRYRFVVLGYVVMPEHVHLLAGGPGGWPRLSTPILLSRVPLDKSEGFVKGTLLLCQRKIESSASPQSRKFRF